MVRSDALIDHRSYINEHGEDHPNVLGWRWGSEAMGAARSSTAADNV